MGIKQGTREMTETVKIRVEKVFIYFVSDCHHRSLDENLSDEGEIKAPISDVMDMLVNKGFPTDEIKFPDGFNAIMHLIERGARLSHFIQAYELAIESQHKPFDLLCLLNYVENLLFAQTEE